VSGQVRRRSVTAVESVTELDVVTPRLPSRTKDQQACVLAAIGVLHQPFEQRITQDVLCTQCGRNWPCATFRLIYGDWTP
jgi:hypothetical protein